MKVVYKMAALMLFGLAGLGLLVLFGVIGNLPNEVTEASVLDSPDAAGRMIGGLLPSLLLAAGGAWLWQRPKPAEARPGC